MSNNVVDLLSARTRRQQAALTFETDLEALLFTASCIDELRKTAADGADLTTAHARMKLDQAAAVVRACIRLHNRESETR
jgi:hypothetical protein